MNHKEKSALLHAKGYNCAQAVACAFCEDFGLDEKLIFKLNEGFGFGFGCGKSACGALSGAVMMAGFKTSSGNLFAPDSKKATYKIAADFTNKFKEKTGSIICEEIKDRGDGTPRISCAQCINLGVELVEEYLDSLK